MADPLWINEAAPGGPPAYSAAELRQAMALALMYGGRNMGGRPGVRPGGNQLQVSLAGSTITVQPGVCALDPALSTPQGPYWVAIPVAENHTLTAADATNARKDIVVVRVYDHDEDASGQRKAQTEYLVGTPNPAPVEPAVPAGAMRLATVDVPASPGAPVVTDRRPWTVAPGGILPVGAASDIAAGVNGRYRHRLDTGQLEWDNGTIWQPVVPTTMYRAAQTLGASASSIVFSSIPTTLRRLVISWTARSTTAAIVANIWMRINGSSALSYSANLMRVNNTTQTNAAEGGVDHASVGVITGASAAANNFGAGEIRVAGWHAPHPNLNWTVESHMYENGPNSWHVSGGGLYFAAGPYTSITLLPDAGQFVAGSDFTLLGWY